MWDVTNEHSCDENNLTPDNHPPVLLRGIVEIEIETVQDKFDFKKDDLFSLAGLKNKLRHQRPLKKSKIVNWTDENFNLKKL